MFKCYLRMLSPCFAPPDTGAGGGSGEGGGSTENGGGTSGAAEAASGGITSGTASDAMIKAATAAESSSAEGSPESEAAIVARVTGETGATPPATGTKIGATTQLAIGAQGAIGDKGPVPFDRHEAAVKNAREAGVNEATERFAWARGLDHESVSAAFNVAGQVVRDPVAFVTKLAGELGLTVSKAGAGAAGAGVTGDPNKALPTPKLRAEDGTLAYSAEQVTEILGIKLAQMELAMEGRLKPLLDDRTEAQKIQARERVVTEARETASKALTEARALPHFQMKDHAGNMVDHPKILINLQAIPADVRRSIGPIAALYQAYNKFLAEDVFPTIGQRSQQQVRDDNARKVAASQGAHPAGATGATGKKELKTVSDLAARMEEMAAATA